MAPLPTPESTISANATACRDMAVARISSRSGRKPKDSQVTYPETFEGIIRKSIQAAEILAKVEKELRDVEHLPEHDAFYLDVGLDKVVASMNSLLLRVRDHGESVRSRQQAISPEEEAQMLAAPAAQDSVIDTVAGIFECLEALEGCLDLNSDLPQLAIDAEGDNLGRDGTLTILTIYCTALNHVYIIDVLSLGNAAFHTAPSADITLTLKQILEDGTLMKLFWDCRGDSKALYHRFGIRLDGVVDVQLLDLAVATKTKDRKKLKALSVSLPLRIFKGKNALSSEWRDIKDLGRTVIRCGIAEAERMHEETGGDLSRAKSRIAEDDPAFEKIEDGFGGTRFVEKPDCKPVHAFAVRPLHPWLAKYCVNDVRWLPTMYWHFVSHRFWNEAWNTRVESETERRLDESRQAERKWSVRNAAPGGWEKVEQVEREGQVEQADETG